MASGKCVQELEYEMIPYTPEELVEIANKEFAWCEGEMKKASRELGYGNEYEMIAYKTEELVEFGNKEFEWCEGEMKKASRELGYVNDYEMIP